MRIDLNSGIGTTETSLEKSAGARRATPAGQNAVEPEFSAAGASVTSLTATALSAPEIRQEKVQALQAQVQSGNYHISAKQIAASMLDQVRAA